MGFDDDTPADAKVRILQHRADAVDARLREGADSFRSVRESLLGLERKLVDATRPSPWRLILALFPILMLLGGLIWAAAHYPDREEFGAAQKSNETKIDGVKADVSEIKADQIRLRGTVERVESAQTRIDSKLDQALQPKRRQP